MPEVWEEKFVAFEKINESPDPHQWSPRMAEVIRNNRSDYKDHSTRAYRLGRNIYVASEMTFRRSEKVEPTPVSFTFTPKDSNHEEAQGDVSEVAKLGKPSSLTYMIYDRRQLWFRTERDGDVDTLCGGPILTLEGKLFKFKEIHFPMTRALHGMSSDVSFQSPRNWSFEMSMCASFKEPKWFTQLECSRIVVPGMAIPDFLSLCVSTCCSTLSSKLFVASVQVELQELTWRTCDGKRPSAWRLRKRRLLEKTCRKLARKMRYSTSSGKLRFELPSSLYDCKLPETEPTSFSNDESRTYGLEISVTFRVEGEPTASVLSTFSEISVAKRNYYYLRRHSNQKITSGPYAYVRSLTVIERFSRALFDPKACGQSKFKDVSALSFASYRSHQTDTYSVDDEIYAVTVINVGNVCPQLNAVILKICEERMVSHFGGDPGFKRNEHFIICEVVEVQGENKDSRELEGGLFVEANGRRLKYTFPFGSPLYRHNPGYDLRICRLPLMMQFVNEVVELVLACKFKAPALFKQSLGETIVLPGMNFADFLELELSLSRKYKDHYPIDFAFRLKKLRISIKEKAHSNDCQYQAFVFTKKLLHEKKLNDSFRWSDFDATRDSNQVRRLVPPELYSCVVPHLGPTFYTEDLYRGYEIKVELSIKVDKEPWLRMMAIRKSIKVAALNRKCITANSAPPSYAAALKEGLPPYMMGEIIEKGIQ